MWLEPLTQFRTIGKMSWQDSYGDDLIEARIAGAVHLAHSPRTNTGENFIGP